MHSFNAIDPLDVKLAKSSYTLLFFVNTYKASGFSLKNEI